MKLTAQFVAELDREAPRCLRVLEEMPEGKSDWKPHERSMAFGYLAELVATMPTWIVLTIEKGELDIAPASGSSITREPLHSRADYVKALEKSTANARAALEKTSDEFLMTNWKLLVKGNVVQESPRYLVIRETFNHLAHHRGQMTVYLRLLGAKVPSIYGPSADDKTFA